MYNRPVLGVSISCQSPLELKISKKLVKYVKETRSDIAAPFICIHIDDVKPSKKVICLHQPIHDTVLSSNLNFIVTSSNQLYVVLVTLIQIAQDHLKQIDSPPERCELSIFVPSTPTDNSDMVYRFEWTLKY